MEYRKLGSTGIEVSVVALGCWPFAGDSNWGPQDDTESIATAHAALDAGINFFDTAEAYGGGKSEEVLGKALAGRRAEAIIADKVSGSHFREADMIASCERSLKLLGTDYIDLYQLHWPDRVVPTDEAMATMEKLKQQGKVREIGVCNYGVGDMNDLFSGHSAVTNQLPYSLLWRVIEHEIQPMCLQKGMGILCYSSIQQGLLAGKFATPADVPDGRARTRHFGSHRAGVRHGEAGCEAETFAAIDRIREIASDVGQPMALVSLAWLLAQPGVTSVLAGGRRPDQVIENVRAAELTLKPPVIEALTEATKEVKAALGTNPDPYQGAANTRYR